LASEYAFAYFKTKWLFLITHFSQLFDESTQYWLDHDKRVSILCTIPIFFLPTGLFHLLE
jgi:hypothetical protein